MAEENVTLSFIGMHLGAADHRGRQPARRLAAILQRLDNSHSNLLTEVRSVHSQISRMNDRLRKVEDKELG